MTSGQKGSGAHVARWFAFLVGLYPGGFRALFGDELQAVFAQRLAAARQEGRMAVLRLCLLEFGGVGTAIVREWWALWQRKEAAMREVEMMTVEGDGRRGAWLAAAPHLLVALVATLWALATLERGVWAQPGVVVVVEAALLLPLLAALAVAWRRGWPRWSGSWAGYGIALGFTFLLNELGPILQAAGAFVPQTSLPLLSRAVWLLWLGGALGGLARLARRDGLAAVLAIVPLLAVMLPYMSADVQAAGLLPLLALVGAASAMIIYRARSVVTGAALVTAHCLVVAMPVAYMSLVEHAYLAPYYGQLTRGDVAASLAASLLGSLFWLLPPLVVVWVGRRAEG